MRYGEKINIKMIPSDALIWVRNCSYMEMKTPFLANSATLMNMKIMNIGHQKYLLLVVTNGSRCVLI